MKNKEIRVVVKQPGQPPQVQMTPDTLSAFQKIVGGDIEHVIWDELDLWCNEEGKLNELQANLFEAVPNDIVVGTVFVSKSNEEGESVSLTEEEAANVIKNLR